MSGNIDPALLLEESRPLEGSSSQGDSFTCVTSSFLVFNSPKDKEPAEEESVRDVAEEPLPPSQEALPESENDVPLGTGLVAHIPSDLEDLLKQYTKLTFVRHAQSTGNDKSNICIDPALTRKGILQASRIKGQYDLVLCSPLRRAIETFEYAKITSKNGVQLEPLAREKIFSITSFLFGEEFGYRKWVTRNRDNEEEDRLEWKVLAPESDQKFLARMRRLKEKIEGLKGKYKSILIITHSKVIRSLLEVKAKNGDQHTIFI